MLGLFDGTIALRTNRWVLLVLSAVQVFTSAGIIFGWASLVVVLKEAGVYASACGAGAGLAADCTARSNRLQMIFTVASSANSVANLSSGLVMDRYGPRVCKLQSHFCVIVGCVLLGYWRPGLDALVLPAITLLGYGGTGLQLASIHLSNLFPGAKSLATCFIVGMFQLSFFVFFVFRMLFDAGAGLNGIFMGYAVLNVANLLVSLVFEPDQPFALEDATAAKLPSPRKLPSPSKLPPHTTAAAAAAAAAADDEYAEDAVAELHEIESGGRFTMMRLPSRWMKHPGTSALLSASPAAPSGGGGGGGVSPSYLALAEGGGATSLNGGGGGDGGGNRAGVRLVARPGSGKAANERTPLVVASGGLPRALRDRSFRAQIASTSFLYLLFFFCVCTLWANFFVGSVAQQLQSGISDVAEMQGLLTAFNYILPGAVVGIPVIGWLLDTYGFVVSIFTTILLGLLFAVGMLSVAYPHPSPRVLIGAFCCYALFRTFLFAVTFAYVGHKFGYSHFGVLSGLLFFFSAGVGFLQYPINNWGAYYEVNVIQLVCLLCTISFPLYEWLQTRSQRKLLLAATATAAPAVVPTMKIHV